MAILASIFALLSKVPGVLGEYFERKQKIEELRYQGELEKEKALIELSKDRAKAEHERLVASLKATGRLFKYFTFIMWFGPYMCGLLYPPLGQQIFENMSIMPQWYVESIVMIMFAIWGISMSSPAVVGIFKGMGNFFAKRRQYKLEKEAINRKAVFDTLRAMFPKGYTQEQVDLIDKALDKAKASDD